MAIVLLAAPAAAADWLCWRGAGLQTAAATPGVHARNRFVDRSLAVGPPARLCTAATAAAVPPGAPPEMAAIWRVRRPSRFTGATAAFTVRNRFGTVPLRVRGPHRLLATPDGWLACHDVQAPRRSGRRPLVVVGDAGGPRTLVLGRPVRLCVAPNGSDAPELLCHRVRAHGRADRATPPDGIVRTALGDVRGTGREPRELCVASVRTTLPPPPDPDPGDPPPPPPPPPPPGPTTLRVTPAARQVIAGDPPALRVIATLPDGRWADWTRKVLFRSSDERVAAGRGSVGGAFVEAVGPGTAVISAFDPATGIASTGEGDATLTVTWPLARVEVYPEWVAMPVGGIARVTVWAILENGQWRDVTKRAVLDVAPAIAAGPPAAPYPGALVGQSLGTARVVATEPISGRSTAELGAGPGSGVDVYVTDGPVRIEVRGRGVSGWYPPARSAGESYRFTAVGIMPDGSERNVTQQVAWETDDPAIAVAPNTPGDRSRIDAASPGTTRVRCRAENGLPCEAAWFDVVGALARIEASAETWSRPVREGHPRWATAIGVYHPFADDWYHGRRNLTQEVVWTSDDPSIAVMPNPPGARSQIEYASGGRTTVFATDPATGIVSNRATVQVAGALEALELMPPVRRRVSVGGSVAFDVRGRFEGGAFLDLDRFLPADYVLEADDPTIAEPYDAGGRPRLRALRPGVTGVRARHPESGVASTTVELTVLGDLVRIVLEPASLVKGIGETHGITGFAEWEPGLRELVTQRLVYRSSDPAVVVAPNEPGNRSRIRAVGPGTAVISATDPVSGVTSTASGDDVVVEVLPGVPVRISIAPASLTLPPNLSVPLTALAHWSDGRTTNVTQQVTWETRNPLVAATPNAPNDRSRIHAAGLGVTTIAASHPAGLGTTATLDDARVRVLNLRTRTLSPAVATGRVGEVVRFTYTGTFTDDSTINLTQHARYDATGRDVAEPLGARGDRSAYRCLAEGTTEVQAISDDLPSLLGILFPSRATLVCAP